MLMFFNRVIQTHQRKTKNSVLKTTLSVVKFSRRQLLTPSPWGLFQTPKYDLCLSERVCKIILRVVWGPS